MQSIKIVYKSKNWDSKEEKLFLKIFCTLHLIEEYNRHWNGYLLKNENNGNACFFDLKNDIFWSSYDDIWGVFKKRFHWNYDEVQQFMKNMLKIHFKLYEFTPLITDKSQTM